MNVPGSYYFTLGSVSLYYQVRSFSYAFTSAAWKMVQAPITVITVFIIMRVLCRPARSNDTLCIRCVCVSPLCVIYQRNSHGEAPSCLDQRPGPCADVSSSRSTTGWRPIAAHACVPHLSFPFAVATCVPVPLHGAALPSSCTHLNTLRLL